MLKTAVVKIRIFTILQRWLPCSVLGQRAFCSAAIMPLGFLDTDG